MLLCVNKQVDFFREQVRDFADDVAAKALPIFVPVFALMSISFFSR